MAPRGGDGGVGVLLKDAVAKEEALGLLRPSTMAARLRDPAAQLGITQELDEQHTAGPAAGVLLATPVELDARERVAPRFRSRGPRERDESRMGPPQRSRTWPPVGDKASEWDLLAAHEQLTDHVCAVIENASTNRPG